MSAHDVEKQVKVYVSVFICLLVLTIVTVAVSYLHLPLHQAVGLALAVAAMKGSLVVCYFMHLVDEKRLIYITLVLTVIFFIGLMTLPVWMHSDPLSAAAPGVA